MRTTQPLVSLLTAYATYLAVKCPCDKTLSCHLGQFFGSLAAAISLVLAENAGLM